MMIIDFATGALLGGLALSACWGGLWLVVAAIGFARGACGARVVVQGVIAVLLPLLLATWGWWMRHDAVSSGMALVTGLSAIPLLVLTLGLRRSPDGRRAAVHMADGMRHLKDQLLGEHHACGGCSHEQEPDAGGCR